MALAGLESQQYVPCGRQLFFVVVKTEQSASKIIPTVSGSCGSGDYYDGGIAGGVAVQSGLPGMGLQRSAHELPWADLSAIFPAVDSTQSSGDGSVFCVRPQDSTKAFRSA